MAISGAAVSSNMGSQTIKPLAFALALLNVRLGYWLRNPFSFKPPDSLEQPDTFLKFKERDSFLRRLADRRSFLLFYEAFSRINEKNRTIYLTDGGHIENLGIYSLMKRRCGVIIAIDAEADPKMSFASLLILERYARIDFGAIIDLPWQAIRDRALGVDKAFDKAGKDSSAIPSWPGPHCAACKISYGGDKNGIPHDGILLYVKASLSGDENDTILDYKRLHPAFPHETTNDQFFGEEQLEAYRALGFHIVKGFLTDKIPFAVKPEPNETEYEARAGILRRVHAALRGQRGWEPLDASPKNHSLRHERHRLRVGFFNSAKA